MYCFQTMLDHGSWSYNRLSLLLFQLSFAFALHFWPYAMFLKAITIMS